ncbi:MAG: Vi polysaccharide biosynthesis UDP-N-acetylglucosamine C-6 dehydrogenase TviB [Pseudomonadota bacterium]|nr:Vi polysaccharide biosynthesis UDP-N-acetylglucosamine C-6 dehydrogenase TviB [Pseudomonadota bacterium]
MPLPTLERATIGVIGLGYVGLPLAAEFGRRFDTRGMDIDARRVAELSAGLDRTLEVASEELAEADRLSFHHDPSELADCNVYIVTVPTPIDRAKRPDLEPLIKASETVGRLLRDGDVVIYESTVYPGATEEICVPILERHSGLVFNTGFHCGYSPERINPGDKDHRLVNILKITSGSTPEAAAFVDSLYASVIQAGTYRASSIRVAEAAKVIENTQRDVNIALVNELALIFNRIGIDTLEVLEAAGTKWNFLPFRPGLVGGHCIGVDPYYLTHKAQETGYHPEMILAGRRINDGMGTYIAGQVMQLMAERGTNIVGARILVLGLGFKENCPDLRNTRVVDLIGEFVKFRAVVDVHDPWVDADEAMRAHGIRLTATPGPECYDAIVIAVGHRQFAAMGADGIRSFGKPGAVLYDVKYILPRESVDGRV